VKWQPLSLKLYTFEVNNKVFREIMKIGRVKSDTTCGCFIAKELYS